MQDLTRSNCKEIKLVTTYLNDLETEASESQQNALLDKQLQYLYMIRSRELQGHIFEKYVLFTVIKSDKIRSVIYRRPGYWHFMLLRQQQVDMQSIRDCLPSQVSLNNCALHPQCANEMMSLSRCPSVVNTEENVPLARSYSEISMVPSSYSSNTAGGDRNSASYVYWQTERSLTSNLISMITVLHYYALLDSLSDSTELHTKPADQCVCDTQESLCLALEELFGWSEVSISIARLCCYSFLTMITNRLPELNRQSEKHASQHQTIQRIGLFLEEFVFYRPLHCKVYSRYRHLSLSSDVADRQTGITAEMVLEKECTDYVYFLLQHIKSEVDNLTIPTGDIADTKPTMLSCMFPDALSFYTSNVAKLTCQPSLLYEKYHTITPPMEQFGMHFGNNGSDDTVLLERFAFLLLKLGWNDDSSNIFYLHDAIPTNMNNTRQYKGQKLTSKRLPPPPPPPPSAIPSACHTPSYAPAGYNPGPRGSMSGPPPPPPPPAASLAGCPVVQTEKLDIIIGTSVAPSVLQPPRMSLLKPNPKIDIRVDPGTPTQLERRGSFSVPGTSANRGASCSRLDTSRVEGHLDMTRRDSFSGCLQTPPPLPGVHTHTSPHNSPRPSHLFLPIATSPQLSPRRDSAIVLDKFVKLDLHGGSVAVKASIEPYHLEQVQPSKKLKKFKETLYEDMTFYFALVKCLKYVYVFPTLPSTVEAYPYDNPLANRYFQSYTNLNANNFNAPVYPVGTMLLQNTPIQSNAQSVLEISRLTAATHYLSGKPDETVQMNLEVDSHKLLLDQLVTLAKKRPLYGKTELQPMLIEQLKLMNCMRRAVFMTTAFTTTTELLKSADVVWKEELHLQTEIPAWAPQQIPVPQIPLPTTPFMRTHVSIDDMESDY